MAKVLFVYGSLKRGFYNHSALKEARFIGEGELCGAKMYDLGSYPCIVLTKNDAEVVQGELYECLSEGRYLGIQRMELGAGYEERTVQIGDVSALTYVFAEVPEDGMPVSDGIWEKH